MGNDGLKVSIQRIWIKRTLGLKLTKLGSFDVAAIATASSMQIHRENRAFRILLEPARGVAGEGGNGGFGENQLETLQKKSSIGRSGVLEFRSTCKHRIPREEKIRIVPADIHMNM